jgi:CRP/FNR family transcriptional regulator
MRYTLSHQRVTRWNPGSIVPLSADELRVSLPELIDVDARAIDQIARGAVERRYAANESLYRAGDPADGLYLVLAGKVLVVRQTALRSELLHTELAGGVLGEIPVFGGGPFPATATAMEPTRCAHVSVTLIERLLRDEPSFARFALRRLARRAQSLLHRIDELTATTIVARLAAFVEQRAAASPSSQFTLGESQSQLATELGTAREVIVRGLAALIDAGAIRRVGRSRFAVQHASVLRSIAGS